MNRYIYSFLFFFFILIVGCEEGNVKYILTDQDGYAEEYFIIPESGKIKITAIDANCNEINKGGKLFYTQYLFTLRDFKVILNSNCTNFSPTEYFEVEKGDKIKMVIKHGEGNTRYKILYDFQGLNKQ